MPGAEANGPQGDQNGCRAGGCEYPPADGDAVGKLLQPFIHSPPGNGKRYYGGQQDQQQELPGKHGGDVACCSAQDLANADFFGTSFGGISDQAKQAEASNENAECGKGVQWPAGL